MRLRVWQQLFLVLAGLLLATLSVAFFAQQKAFSLGLLDYVNELDRQRADVVVERLARLYDEESGFTSLVDFPGSFRRLVSQASQLGAADAIAVGESFRGHARSDMNQAERAPVGAAARASGSRGRPPPPSAGPSDLFARLQLTDLQGLRIAGNPRVGVDATAIPIRVGEREVARLLLAPLPGLSNAADLAFARRQSVAALMIASCVLIAALLVSLLLSRQLTRPLRAVVAAAQALAAGQAAPRVPVKGQGEMAELATDFNRLAEVLERNRKLRQQWTAEISHELRTPLCVLRGEIEALICGVRPLDVAALQSLEGEAAQLSKMIDDLYELSLADLGALEYRFEALDLGALIREVAQAHEHTLGAAGLALNVEIDAAEVPVRADARRLRQLCANLLVNAQRYSDPGGRIEIAVNRVGSQARVRVDDTPPGVAAEELPQLFERFFRSERSRSRAHGGAGLGLAICRNIALAHGGEISASASPLGGVRIELLLPLGAGP